MVFLGRVWGKNSSTKEGSSRKDGFTRKRARTVLGLDEKVEPSRDDWGRYYIHA